MNFIKKQIDDKKAISSLCNHLHARLEYKHSGRSPHKVHASDITKEDPEFCPREVVLLRLTNTKRPDVTHSAALKVTFSIGDSYHDLIRNDWLRDIAVGDWSCSHCGNTYRFCKVPVIACEKCGSTKWEYSEVTFWSNELEVSGAIDLIVDLGLKKHVVVEIKSMDKDQFKDLKAPLAEHRIRTSLYLRIIEGSNFIHKDKLESTYARILYISKGFGIKEEGVGFTPFKEFIVDRNDNVIEGPMAKALAVKLHGDTGIVPSGVCANSFVRRVNSCYANKHCFTSKYPAGSYIPLVDQSSS